MAILSALSHLIWSTVAILSAGAVLSGTGHANDAVATFDGDSGVGVGGRLLVFGERDAGGQVEVAPMH
jgi:hypothetical protein